MKIRRNSYRAGAKRKIDKGAASHSPRPARGPTDQARRQAGCEQIQLPSTGAVAGLGGALEGRGGAPRSTPRQPTGRPPTPFLSGRNRTPDNPLREYKRVEHKGVHRGQESFP